MKKIAFVCIHNSCRSQMAEAIAKEYLKEKDVEIYSAGTQEYPEIKPMVIETLEKVNIKVNNQYPKLLADIPKDIDILITMGCGVECPYVPAKSIEDWGLDDPSGKGIEAFDITRDLIIKKVKHLKTKI
ncbi:arsenate reductase ArsC [Mycoplasma sp. P36-A1]|uniref:arsenate reductase ArsC n=1 Tax=Mycoplasma sp. P36-A1 TaxID=3252900 RepID=UPI003C300D33